MSRNSLQKIKSHLFDDVEKCEGILTPTEIKMKQRYMLCVTRKLEKPLTPDKELHDFLRSGCGGLTEPVSSSQAYRDIAAITQMVGDIQPAAKNWMRHMIVEGAKQIYEMAMAHHDAKGAAAALDKLGKYTRCDKDDDSMDWSEMLPPIFEPSDDITLIDGLEVIAPKNLESERRRLRELFGKLSSDIEEARLADES